MTPEAVHERFAQYLKNQDLDGLGSLFDEDAMFVPRDSSPSTAGKASRKR